MYTLIFWFVWIPDIYHSTMLRAEGRPREGDDRRWRDQLPGVPNSQLHSIASTTQRKLGTVREVRAALDRLVRIRPPGTARRGPPDAPVLPEAGRAPSPPQG
ncbi:Hypothetical_protein [Hexamita inflata]|uniref:Hypothetical_protein n=1 Tax=Hexamita inflata TaxID=28002 RepID=A0ABP1KCN8_9EUKA